MTNNPRCIQNQFRNPSFLETRNQKKYNLTQKTIEQLKKSLGSIEKMIQKSQQILRRTRHLEPREVHSDSLELKLINKSKAKREKNSHLIYHQELGKSSKNSTLTNLNTTLHTDKNYSSKQSIILNKITQKTQYIRPHLIIDTQNINDKIFTNQQIVSPISAISHRRQGIESSFFESPHHFTKKLKYSNIHDSHLAQSLERQKSNQIDNQSKYYTNTDTKKQLTFKRNIFDYRNHHLKTPKPEHKSPPPKRRCIFEKTSQCLKNNFKNTQIINPKKIDNLNENTYNKLNKQKQNINLQDFCQRVKQFGFIQKYLTHTEIVNIFQFLKKSQIPQHKWPLFVVDKIYEKMNSFHKNKC